MSDIAEMDTTGSEDDDVVIIGESKSQEYIKLSAEKKKIDGNELYKRREYTQAIKLYTEAIELFPHCAPYYSNRSACYMMLGKYTKALSDARESVRLDPISAKNYVRIAKCHVALGDPNAAQAVLRQTAELQADDQAVKEETANAEALQRLLEEVNKAVGRKDYRMAIYQLDQTLKLASGCSNLRITKAEYLAFLKRYGEAQEIVNDILQFDSTNVDALYVRGMCLYYQSNPEAAFTHFQHVLRMAPDHKKAKDIYKKAKLIQQKKAEGNEAFKKGTLTEALAIYTEALSIDPNNTATNSKLYCNRATVRAKLGKMDAAVEDCTAAINLDEGYVKAYLRRAKCFQEQGKHEEAVRDYEKVLKLDRNQDHKRFLQEAKVLLKKSKLKDYYTILGISKTATEDEIKKSYKKMALQHHPDRHTNATDIEKQDHEVKFKEIGEAYTVLTDAKKKAMYDKGQDINDPDCGFYGDDFDATRLFQTLFTPRDGEFIFTAEDFPGGAAGTTDYNFSTGFPGNGGFRFRF